MAKERNTVEGKIITKPIKKVVIKKPRPSQKNEISETKTNDKVEITPTVKPEIVKKPRKVVVKKPKPIVVKPDIPKKLTKKQLEKQIENEKIDNTVPQQAPKKSENFMVEATPSTKRSEDKYISISEKANIDERKIISDKIHKNEIVFSHYCINNDLGYHYYRILTK